jgi:DNA-binding transcriptional regulator YdaS (Cro superfamily)
MASALAAHLGVSKACISRWGMIPAEKVSAVSDYTGWPHSLLRPDLWPPAKAKAKAKRKRAAKRTNGRAK